jgi:hypothetical protein
MPLVYLLILLGLEGIEAPLALGDGAVEAVPGSSTMGIDDATNIAPRDNTEVLALLVQLAPLVEKSRHPTLAPLLAAPPLWSVGLLLGMVNKRYGGWCCELLSSVVVRAALIKLLVE